MHGKPLSEANLSILEKGYLAPPASPIPGGDAPIPVSASMDWRFLCQECDFNSDLSEGELQELVNFIGVEAILSTDSQVEAALESQAALYGGDSAAVGSPKDTVHSPGGDSAAVGSPKDMVHSPFGRKQLVSQAYFADSESERDIDSQSIEPGPGPYAMVVWLPGVALEPIDTVEADNSEAVSLTAFEAASELEAGGTQIRRWYSGWRHSNGLLAALKSTRTLMATLKWTLAALKSTLMALRLRWMRKSRPFSVSQRLWRRSMRGFQSLALRSSTSARRPPTRRAQVLATSARPRILARSARIARPR